MRCAWVPAAVLVWAAAAAAETDTDALFQHRVSSSDLPALIAPQALKTAATAALRGRFEQRKYLPELPRPLLSTGDFVLARDVGVRWHTRTPFDSVFVLSREGMSTHDEGGTLTSIRAQDQPGVAEAARILFELFALDFAALEGDFDIYGSANAGSAASRPWQVGLRPKQSALAAIFKEAIVAGSDRASRIELHDAHGDRTEILLLDVLASPAGLTADERQRFAE